jgi:hypothetical protein
VVARFIRQGKTADQAILEKLKRLGGEARNWTVVSSDREVQVNARAAHAKTLRSEVFSQQLSGVLAEKSHDLSEQEAELSSQEVEDWMNVFGIDEADEES